MTVEGFDQLDDPVDQERVSDLLQSLLQQDDVKRLIAQLVLEDGRTLQIYREGLFTLVRDEA